MLLTFLFAEFPGASHRRCSIAATLGEPPERHDGHEARSSLEAAHDVSSETRCLHGMLALCPLSPIVGVECSGGGGGDATATATTADAKSTTQQHRELTNNGGDSSIGVRDSSGQCVPIVSGSKPGPQDRTARTPSGTQAGSRLQKAYQTVTRERRVQLKEDDFVYQGAWRLRLLSVINPEELLEIEDREF